VSGNALMLELMRFSSELVDAGEYSFPSSELVKPQELQMAEQLVENLTEEFNATKYVDEYRANLMKIIKAKMKGRKPRLETHEEERDSDVIDLMARLRESLDRGAATGKPAKGRAVKTARSKSTSSGRGKRKSA
jgi:DNA end-binding protein Ku